MNHITLAMTPLTFREVPLQVFLDTPAPFKTKWTLVTANEAPYIYLPLQGLSARKLLEDYLVKTVTENSIPTTYTIIQREAQNVTENNKPERPVREDKGDSGQTQGCSQTG